MKMLFGTLITKNTPLGGYTQLNAIMSTSMEALNYDGSLLSMSSNDKNFLPSLIAILIMID